MKKGCVLFLAVACAMPVYSQGFGDHLMDCTSGDKKRIEIFIGDDAIASSNAQRKKMRKLGMVGLLWNSNYYQSIEKKEKPKPVWAKPEKLSENSYRMAFPGRSPFVFTYLQPSDMNKPSVKIEEAGGKVWMCHINLEMLNKGI